MSTRFITVTPEYPTGTVSVEISNSGEPHYIIHEQVAWDHIAATPDLLQLAATTDAVCFGTLAQRSTQSRTAIKQFLDTTRLDCLRVFDVNLRQSFFSPELLRQGLSRCNVLKLNEHEWPILAAAIGLPSSLPDGLAQIRSQFELKLVALTCGAAGSTLCDASGVISRPTAGDVRVVDTIGAGDSFTAALVIGLLRGYSIERIHVNATELSGFVCSQPGATPLAPESLLRRIR